MTRSRPGGHHPRSVAPKLGGAGRRRSRRSTPLGLGIGQGRVGALQGDAHGQRFFRRRRPAARGTHRKTSAARTPGDGRVRRAATVGRRHAGIENTTAQIALDRREARRRDETRPRSCARARPSISITAATTSSAIPRRSAQQPRIDPRPATPMRIPVALSIAAVFPGCRRARGRALHGRRASGHTARTAASRSALKRGERRARARTVRRRARSPRRRRSRRCARAGSAARVAKTWPISNVSGRGAAGRGRCIAKLRGQHRERIQRWSSDSGLMISTTAGTRFRASGPALGGRRRLQVQRDEFAVTEARQRRTDRVVAIQGLARSVCGGPPESRLRCGRTAMRRDLLDDIGRDRDVGRHGGAVTAKARRALRPRSLATAAPASSPSETRSRAAA